MARRKVDKAKQVEQTAAYIIQQIDSTSWQDVLDAHAYCRDCPARPGVSLGLDDDAIDLCGACPLRPLMYALADLVMRQRREAP